MIMETEDITKSDWFKERPKIIQEAIENLPPTNLYSLNGKQCHIISYEEPESGLSKDVTVMVQKTGVGGVLAEMGMGELDTNRVFGIKPEDLKIWEEQPTTN